MILGTSIVGGSPAALIYQASSGQTVNATSHTYNGVAFGSAANRSAVFVFVSVSLAFSITGVTIGGVAATLVGQIDNVVALYQAQPAGTSGSIVINWSGTQNTSSIDVYSGYHMRSLAPVATASFRYNVGVAGSGSALNANTLGRGFAIGCASLGGSPTTWTWSGLTVDFTNTSGGIPRAAASLNTAISETPRSISASSSTSGIVREALVASFR